MKKSLRVRSRFWGSTLLLTGTALGGGVLPLPLLLAPLGIVKASCVFLFFAFYAYLVAQPLINLSALFPESASLNSMAKKNSGSMVLALINIAFLLLSYSLLTAYISSGAIFLKTAFKLFGIKEIKSFFYFFLFASGFGILIFLGIAVVDRINKFLIILKAGLLFILAICIIPKISQSGLVSVFDNITTNNFSYFMIPTIFTGFGFQISIPAIANYYQANKKDQNLKRQLNKIVRTVVLLIALVYLTWIIIVFAISSNLPSLIEINPLMQSNFEKFSILLHKGIRNQYLGKSINIFADVAITTSFLGVSIALVNFLRDLLPKRLLGGSGTIFFCTYLPPIFFAVFVPDVFIKSLSYSSIPLLCLTVFFPLVMLRNRSLKENYKTYILLGGALVIIASLIFSLFSS